MNFFKEILIDLNKTLDDKEKFNINIEFDFSINEENYNEINIEFITPYALRGLNLFHKFYKALIRKFKFITSNDRSSDFSKNIWYKLFTNSEIKSIFYINYDIAELLINSGVDVNIKNNAGDDALSYINMNLNTVRYKLKPTGNNVRLQLIFI